MQARFSEDRTYYEAVVKQVIHGGFAIAKYTVLYTAYGNSEVVSWKDIIAEAKSGSSDSDDDDGGGGDEKHYPSDERVGYDTYKINQGYRSPPRYQEDDDAPKDQMAVGHGTSDVTSGGVASAASSVIASFERGNEVPLPHPVVVNPLALSRAGRQGWRSKVRKARQQ